MKWRAKKKGEELSALAASFRIALCSPRHVETSSSEEDPSTVPAFLPAVTAARRAIVWWRGPNYISVPAFLPASTAVHAPEGKDSEVTALKRSASFLLLVWRFLRRKSRFKVRVHENKRRRGDPIPRAYVLDKQSDPQSNEIDGCRGFDTASGHLSVPTFVVCGHRLVTLSSKTDRAENWEAPY